MRIAFNELSAGAPVASRQEGRKLLEDMIRGALAIANSEPLELIAVRGWDMFGMLIGSEYTVSDWLHDGDRDLIKLFYKITNKIGVGERIDSAVKDRFYVSTFLVGDRRRPNRSIEAPGLGLAHLLDGVATSLASDEQWCKSGIDLCHVWLDEEGQEHIDDVEVVNVSRLANAEAAANRLYRLWQEDARDRREAMAGVRSVAGMFRHLAFGMDVEEQFKALAGDARRVTRSKLIEFDAAVREWRREGTTLPMLPGVRSEGKATMDRFGEDRVYRNRHGEAAVYKLHVSAGSCRIHFRVEAAEKMVEIGYVGRHLPTKKFH